MRVRVYRNLKHGRKTQPLYSIMDVKTRRVIDRRHVVLLSDAKFIVNEAGRQRVLKEQRKNVHAFVEGDLMPQQIGLHSDFAVYRVLYNPYTRGEFFTSVPPNDAVKTARYVQLDGSGIAAVGVNLK